MISRRHFLGASAGVLISARAAAAPARPVGLQLYTIADALRQDFAGALRTVAAIGYRAVETGLTLGGHEAPQLKRTFADLGLAWDSAHCNGEELQSGLDRTIATALAVGLKYIVCALPPIPGSFKQAIAGISLDDWKRNAELFNRIGAALRGEGLQFAYHNHNIEFRRDGKTTGYDTLLAETDRDLVKLELDCGWMASAGLDPVGYLTRYPERYVMLHLKDLKREHIPNTALEMAGTEVGSGIIDWKRLLAAADVAAVKGFYVEQEPPFAHSSLDSIKISYDYLRNLTF
jgi:sugar phosphate isomerase/epimerase